MMTTNSIRVSAIEGNTQLLDGGAMFGNAPRAMWQKWQQPDELGRIKLACRALLVEVGARKILLETGIGAYLEPKLKQRYGVVEDDHRLLTNLAAAGISENDIDTVILSHLHFDHAGGLLPAYSEQNPVPDRLLFPQAKYITSQHHYNRAKNPHPRDRASFIPVLLDLLDRSGRLELIEHHQNSSSLLPPEFSFIFSDGHTPGLMLTKVKGPTHTIVFLGDLIPGAAWCHIPITMGYDRFAELVIDEKTNLYKDLEGEAWLGFFTHDPDMAAASIVRAENGRYQVDKRHDQMHHLMI